MRKEIRKSTQSTSRLSKSRGSIPAPKRRTHRRPWDWSRINRGLRRIAFVGLAVELGLAIFVNPALRVTKVRVDGARILSPQQIFEEAKVPSGSNIFWMALRQPFGRRLEQNPVVAHASRRIQLPDTLILQITERQPFATLATEGQYWLMDAKGVPYRLLDKAYPGVPLVSMQHGGAQNKLVLGQPLQVSWLAKTYALIGLLAQNRSLEATKISVDQNANICLNRKDHLQILLGQPEALPQKVALAQAAVLANEGAILHRAAYIDVSCPQLPVWRPRPEVEDAPLRSHAREENQTSEDAAVQRL